MPVLTLSEISPGQEADLFLLMTAKEELKTKTKKPYFRVGFRDGGREVTFPIWGDSPWAADCRDRWNPGVFYKIRAVYQETSFGPQLEIRKIREVVDGRRGRRIRPDALPAPDPFRSADNVRRTADASPSSTSATPPAPVGRVALDDQPRGAADASGRAAKPPRLCWAGCWSIR